MWEQLKLDSKLQWFCSFFHKQIGHLTLKHCCSPPGEDDSRQEWEKHQPTDMFTF